ncbi:hypothetical protein L195_g041274, partial [Trifolium pratense]
APPHDHYILKNDNEPGNNIDMSWESVWRLGTPEKKSNHYIPTTTVMAEVVSVEPNLNQRVANYTHGSKYFRIWNQKHIHS